MKRDDLPTKTCEVCGTAFVPFTTFQTLCGKVSCALNYGRRLGKQRKAKVKAEREQTKARKKALERIPELTKKAQAAFNAWVRSRDHDKPCISCGAPPPDLSKLHAGRDAGHYRSVGAASHLRFHEDNCHAQCVHCNQWRAGKAVDYRIGLIARIGQARVEALEADNTPRKWGRDELREIASTYHAKRRELETT